MFGFIKKGLKKVGHAVSSVAHSHLFQQIAGGIAMVFPPAAAAVAAVEVVGNVAQHGLTPGALTGALHNVVGMVPGVGAAAQQAMSAAELMATHGLTHGALQAAHAAAIPGVPVAAVAQHIQHGFDAADHLISAFNSHDPADRAEAKAVLDHTTKLAHEGHKDAQAALKIVAQRHAAHRERVHFFVDHKTGRIIDRRTQNHACVSGHCPPALSH